MACLHKEIHRMSAPLPLVSRDTPKFLFNAFCCCLIAIAVCLPSYAPASTSQWRWEGFQAYGKTTPASDYSYPTPQAALEALGRTHFNGYLGKTNHYSYYYYQLSDQLSCNSNATSCSGKIKIEHCYAPYGTSPATRGLWRAQSVQPFSAVPVLPASGYTWPDGVSAMRSQARTEIDHLVDEKLVYMFNYWDWDWGSDSCAGATSCGGRALIEECYIASGYTPETRDKWGPDILTNYATHAPCGTRSFPYSSAEEAMDAQGASCFSGINEYYNYTYKYLGFTNPRYSDPDALDGQPRVLWADVEVRRCANANNVCRTLSLPHVPVIRGACWDSSVHLGAREGSCQIVELPASVSALENGEADPKNAGECTKNNPIKTPNPIHIATGNKHQKASDYPGYGASPLSFTRHYNSQNNSQGGLGVGWTHTYSRRIEHSASKVWVFRHDGKVLSFTNDNGTWQGDPDIADRLEQIPTGWRYTTHREIEEYDAQGRLVTLTSTTGGLAQRLSYNDKGQLKSVTGPFQRSLSFNYDDIANMITSVTTPDGVVTYTYDAAGNLVAVGYPDEAQRTYHYNEPEHTSGTDLPHALTGITDERGIRYATYEYDAAGLAVASYHGPVTGVLADRIDGLTIDRGGNGIHTITNSQGAKTTYTTDNVWNTELVTGIAGPACSSCGTGDTTYERDPANNNLLAKTKGGIRTEYGDYDNYGNPGYRIDAAGTADQRRTDYVYDPRFHGKIAKIIEPSVITEFRYDDAGHLLSKSEIPVP